MKMRLLEKTIFIHQPREQVFEFFSKAENLDKVTPNWLNFKIITSTPIEMKKGAIIDYKLKLYGMPVKWQTEITEWQPPYRFIDVQVKGPYRLWVHEHIFEERDGGTLMTDRVQYLAPGYFLEPIVHKLFVLRDVDRIFRYREKVFSNIFNTAKQTADH